MKVSRFQASGNVLGRLISKKAVCSSKAAGCPADDNLKPVACRPKGDILNREQSWELMCTWTESDSLRKHMLAVEAAMRAYARRFGEDEEKWGITGLLHDMDYEKHPTPDEHPMVGVRELESRGYPEDVIHAIKGHADYLDVPRDTLMSKTLYAVDELSGFIVACALMRPEGLENMKAKSVRKKMKQKSFAAAVNRDDIVRGAEELGVDLNEHIEFVAHALKERSGELGFTPREA
jgi:putative nucleotidyltransferase with HDIG domain